MRKDDELERMKR